MPGHIQKAMIKVIHTIKRCFSCRPSRPQKRWFGLNTGNILSYLEFSFLKSKSNQKCDVSEQNFVPITACQENVAAPDPPGAFVTLSRLSDLTTAVEGK